jgi:hypothetical protein
MVGLHGLLALGSALVVAFAGVEGVLRTWRDRPPGPLAARATTLVLILLGMTMAGGLGLLLGGRRPHEGLHLLYAPLAFAVLPVADRLSSGTTPRKRGLATVGAAVLGLGLMARLVATG